MSVTKLYTAQDLLAMGSDARYELIEGELVEVSPSEGFSSELGGHLFSSLHAFVYGHRLGRLTGEAGGYLLTKNPDSVLAPDIGFIRAELAPRPLPRGAFVPHPPDLAIEVMSGWDRFVDLERKARALPRRRHAPGLGRAVRPADRGRLRARAAARSNSARTTDARRRGRAAGVPPAGARGRSRTRSTHDDRVTSRPLCAIAPEATMSVTKLLHRRRPGRDGLRRAVRAGRRRTGRGVAVEGAGNGVCAQHRRTAAAIRPPPQPRPRLRRRRRLPANARSRHGPRPRCRLHPPRARCPTACRRTGLSRIRPIWRSR